MFRLSEHQLERIRPYLPQISWREPGDESKVLSGSISVLHNSLPWVDTPPVYAPHKTLYNRCRRWSDKGVFTLIFSELARSDGTETETGAEVLLRDLSEARALMADKGYDSNRIRTLLLEQGITPCLPVRRNRRQPVPSARGLENGP